MDHLEADNPTLAGHPCFDAAARHTTSRVHLPVAPRCNVQCNFCNRKFDCLSESRPGVTSGVLTPRQAADYLDRTVDEVPNLAVVGIAGPGDPFANADETLETLRLARERHPELLLCLASNGLGLPPYLDDIAALGVSHVTITLNTTDVETGARIYRWVRDGKVVYRGTMGAELLLDHQLAAIAGLKARGVTVKINTILLPGVNLDEIETVARAAAELGADTMNCVPLYPVAETPFAELGEPTPAQVAVARAAAGRHVHQMTHCARCRADAVGMLGVENDAASRERLAAVMRPGSDRPYVAAASLEGYFVNQHLGAADKLYLFEAAPDGSARPAATRPTPGGGGGSRRWLALADSLGDCRALLVSQLGGSPREVLTRAGITIYETNGLIAEAAAAVFAGREPAALLPRRGCGTCAGPGTGCG
jgi:nitrogen fixation protein NifB